MADGDRQTDKNEGEGSSSENFSPAALLPWGDFPLLAGAFLMGPHERRGFI